MAEIKKLLDDAIETEINNLNSASDKDEKSEVIKNLAALHKLRIEEIKTETEIEEKSERRAMDKAAHDEDATLKAFQLDENTLDRYAKIGIAAAELVLPLMFYGVWMRRGLRFEETGTFTSQTFKNLFNRFKPKSEKYLIDELQMMLSAMNVEAATVDCDCIEVLCGQQKEGL